MDFGNKLPPSPVSEHDTLLNTFSFLESMQVYGPWTLKYLWARISNTRQRKLTKFQLTTKIIHPRNYTRNSVSEPGFARNKAILIKATFQVLASLYKSLDLIWQAKR